MLTPQRSKARSDLANAAAKVSRHPDDPSAAEALIAARRDYYATALADHIRKVVDAAPPLTDEQRDRLAALLRVPA